MKFAVSQLALATALGTVFLPAQSRAEAAEDLGTITLSALRTAAEISRSGVSITLADGADLARSGAVRLTDYLARLPGVSVVGQGSFGNNSVVRMRGFDGRYVAYLIDGIRVDDPSGPQVQTDFGSQMTGGIARLEVLRGSQSALWGGSAVAGVITAQTLDAPEPGLHQRAGLEVGGMNSRRLNYGLTQGGERLDLALNLESFRTDGVSAFDGGSETDGGRASRLSFAARYRVSDAVTLGGSAFVQRSANDYDGYIDTNGDGYGDTFADLPNFQTKREVGARVFGQIEAGSTLHELSASSYHLSRAISDENGNSSFTGTRRVIDWKATTEVSPAITMVYGLDWMREGARTSAQPGGAGSSRVTGIWGQLVWAPSETLDISATLRHDEHSAFGGFQTGRLAASWRPSEAVTLRGAVARGFRAPSLDELYGDYPGFFFTGNPNLQPETSLSYELGVDYDAGNGTALSVTAFRLGISDRIAADPASYWSTLANLPGRSTSRGIEVSARGQLAPNLSAGLSYTYTDARDPNGARMLRVPRHNLVLDLQAALGDRLDARLSLQHLGGRMDSDVNTFQPVVLPDVTLLGLGLDYRLGDSVSASLRIENLTDRHYQSSHGYGAPGRTAYLGLEAKF